MGLAAFVAQPVASSQVKGRGKLGPKYFGPYRIVEHIGDVAYRLELRQGARIHDVFHVGLLKPFYGQPPVQPSPLPLLHHGRVQVEPEQVLKRCEVLVKWKNAAAAESSWVELDEFSWAVPLVSARGELLFHGGRDVMWGLSYGRRKQKQEGVQESGV